MTLMTMENHNDMCRCGHTLLGHVHFNADLGLPDNATTYCGIPNGIGDCECSTYTPTKSPICVCGHGAGFHALDESEKLKCFGTENCDCFGYEWENVRVAKIQDGENSFFTDDLTHPKARNAETFIMPRRAYQAIPATLESQEFFQNA